MSSNNQANNIVISWYPLTRDDLRRLKELTGGNNSTVVISNVRASGYLDILSNLRSMHSEAVYLVIPNQAAFSFLPLMRLLSFFIQVHKRFVVDPDFFIRPYGYASGVDAVLSLAKSGIIGWVHLVLAWYRFGRLLKKRRITISENEVKSVLYLKTTLWHGTRAGGALTHLRGVIGSLLSRGLKVRLVTTEIPSNLSPESGLIEDTIHPIGAFVVPRELNHYIFDAHLVNIMANRAQPDCDAIYQRLSLGSIAGVILSRRWRLPLILEYNGSEPWLARHWGDPLLFERLAKKSEDICLHHAHLIVTVSKVLKDELVERGVEPERIVVHANGVNVDEFDPARISSEEMTAVRESYGIPSDAYVVTFVGTFGQWHGADILAEAVNRMALNDPDWMKEKKVRFLFVGDGPGRSEVEERLSNPDVQGYSFVAGLEQPSRIPVIMAASDVLVSPHVANSDGTPFFGSPTKLFEYLASGKPVVASNLNQVGSILEGSPTTETILSDQAENHGACGVLVRPGDADDLIKAIRFLAEHPEWGSKAGKNGLSRARDRYTWDHHLSAILEGMKRILAMDGAVSRPIRILFNALHSKSGGGVTYLRNVLPLMAKDKGFDVHICVHDDQRDLLPNELENGTQHFLTHRLGFWRNLIHEQISVPALAHRIGAKVIFSPANYGPFFGPPSVILLRNALGVALVERRPIKIAYWILLYLGTLISVLRASQVIAVSMAATVMLGANLTGFFRSKISIVPHGVSKKFSQGRETRESFLLAVSDIYVQKNLKTLVEAVALLREHHPDILLKVAGKTIDVDYFDSVQRLVVDLGLSNNVKFLDSVSSDELVSLYRRCAVFVFPSTVETFGNPLVEAMASGAPIATSNTAAMPEIVGDAGVYFSPYDSGHMAAVIGDLLGDADKRKQLSEKALVRAREFSWQSTADRTLDVIRKAATL
ncbi:MAG: glycosyltransferase [Rhodospirillales bacterium]|nr:glycosyltransferase [Rhodospirillales bacterium]